MADVTILRRAAIPAGRAGSRSPARRRMPQTSSGALRRAETLSKAAGLPSSRRRLQPHRDPFIAISATPISSEFATFLTISADVSPRQSAKRGVPTKWIRLMRWAGAEERPRPALTLLAPLRLDDVHALSLVRKKKSSARPARLRGPRIATP